MRLLISEYWTPVFLLIQLSSAWIHHHQNARFRWLSTHHHAKVMSSSTRLYANSHLLSLQECLSLFHDKCPSVKFVDGTWFHKGDRVGRTEFEHGPRIPNSVFFDIVDVSSSSQEHPSINNNNNNNNLKCMLPTPSLFAAVMDQLNITNDDHVIVYGRQGHLFLPRVWFTFSIMGHANVSIMQGSLSDWMKEGGPVDTSRTSVIQATTLKTFQEDTLSYYYTATMQPNIVVTSQDVLKSLNNPSIQLVDARGSSFQKKGHIPHSIHIPYSSLSDHGVMKSPSELLAIFESAGVNPLDREASIICTCGHGVSACSLYLALKACGRPADAPTYMYDGSWNEWSQDESLPKVLPTQGS